MAHFVKQRKQHIAGYEFRESLTIFWRKAFVPLITGVRERSGVDPGLKLLPLGRRRLRENRLDGEHERQKQQNMPEESRLHGSQPSYQSVLTNAPTIARWTGGM